MTDVDFISIRKVNVGIINEESLAPHPTIANRFSLRDNHKYADKIRGSELEIFYNGSLLTIKNSVGYILHGHNYVHVNEKVLLETFRMLGEILGVDLSESIVCEFEFGTIIPNLTFTQFIERYSGFEGMSSKQNDDNFRFYANNKRHLKVYDTQINLRRKVWKGVSKEDFNSIDFSDGSLKIETKYTNPKNTSGGKLLLKELCTASKMNELIVSLYSDLGTAQQFKQQHVIDRSASFADILYQSMLKCSPEQENHTSIDTVILETINNSKDLSHSKKTNRRNSLKSLLSETKSLIQEDSLQELYKDIMDRYDYNIDAMLNNNNHKN